MKLKTAATDIRERMGTMFDAACWTLIITMLVTAAFGVRPGLVMGTSMQPTLSEGDLMLLRTSGYTLEHGSVAVFQCKSLNKLLVKRVIGLPGDTIELIGTELYRNGELLDEPYAVRNLYNFGDKPSTYFVEEGHLFVLGDNRPVSNDSRYDAVGQVEFDDVVGILIDSSTPPKAAAELLRAAAATKMAAADALHECLSPRSSKAIFFRPKCASF